MTHYYYDYDDDDNDRQGSELSLLGRLIIDYQTANHEAFQAVLDECCDSSRTDSPATIDTKDTVLTPLLLAVRRGLLAIVKLLVVKFKANPSLPAVHGRKRTPLQEAAEKGHFEIAEWLLDNGADVNSNAQPECGATALQLAAIGGYGGIMEILINRGADLNAPGAVINGRTALEGAAEHGRLDAVKLLLDSGVVITGSEKRPFWQARRYARERGQDSVVKILDYHWELHTCQTVDHGHLLEELVLNPYYDDNEDGSSSGDDDRDGYSHDDEYSDDDGYFDDDKY
ncbi:ankyrin repeat domain-containing protein 50 [Microdochium nivale]|nr:ankyrin repeat domain-containing protein 50 [Microdochium nivale]